MPATPAFSVKFKFSLFFFLILCLSQFIQAQQYWQQEVNYNIRVRLDDHRHTLDGDIRLEYTNHSPDKLFFIYFHLWPNAYKNNETAMARQKLKSNPNQRLFKDSLRNGYMDSIHFLVDGQPVVVELHPEHNDIVKIILNKPLDSGATTTISTPFHVKIPWGGISRMGHIGQSYQISQWYPKPAVYDATGWHPIPYLDQGEFYSEWGSFDVSITLPANYIVASTGELQTPSEQDWLNTLAARDAQLDTFDRKNPEIASDSIYKTIRYTEKHIHDFAWFADKSFHVLKGQTTLPSSGRTITTWSFFPGRVGKFWKKSPEYIRDALLHYSSLLGEYPYNNCTALEGPLGAGGGMEYPEITIVSSGSTDLMLDEVITHEVGHNWVYGLLGFNERDYPYLDEGLNTFYEMRYLRKKYPESNLTAMMPLPDFLAKTIEIDKMPLRSYYEIMYLMSARANNDQPLNLTSTAYSSLNYGTLVYSKSGLCYDYLKNYLGEAEFDRIMHLFFDKWKFKHPQPADLRSIFTENASKDVAWFFDQVIPTKDKLNYKLVRSHKNEVLIKNKGSLATPFPLTGYKNDSIIWEQWTPGFSGRQWISVPEKVTDKLVLDGQHETPELYRNNNYLFPEAILPGWKPLNFKFLTTFHEEGKNVVQYLPVPGWNYSNKFMLGALFHNGFLLKKPWEYQLMPMYGFWGNKLAGMGKITRNIFPDASNIRILAISLSGQQFAFDEHLDYRKLKVEMKAVFHNSDHTLFQKNTLSFSYTHASNLQELWNAREKYVNLYLLSYSYRQPFQYNFSSADVKLESYEKQIKTTLEGIYNWKAGFMKTPVKFRIFAGAMIHSLANHPFNLQVAGRNGYSDYSFENIMPGRFATNGMLARQFNPVDGGFSTPYQIFADQYLLAANCEFRLLPKSIFRLVRIYGNVAQYKNSTEQKFIYEAGVKFGQPDLFEVYFPVIFSDHDLNYTQYSSLIRFNLNIRLLNPFTLMDRTIKM